MMVPGTGVLQRGVGEVANLLPGTAPARRAMSAVRRLATDLRAPGGFDLPESPLPDPALQFLFQPKG